MRLFNLLLVSRKSINLNMINPGKKNFFRGGTEAKDREFPHMALIGFGEGKPEGK